MRVQAKEMYIGVAMAAFTKETTRIIYGIGYLKCYVTAILIFEP